MSEGFSADWLALREPHDAAARSSVLLRHLAEWCRGRDMLRVVDLGAGTGSNLRCTAPVLGGAQDWTLVELDPALIAAGQQRLAAATVGWRYRRLDLARDLEQLGGQPIGLITASALIDLVGGAWLHRLAAWRAAAGAALYIVLSFDGRIEWQPQDEGDAPVRDLVDCHQRRDKGFGRALGPDAASSLRALLAASAGQLLVETSDWVLSEGDHAIQAALLDGYETMAAELSPERQAETAAWAGRRRRLIGEGRSRLRVCHLDLLFLPQR